MNLLHLKEELSRIAALKPHLDGLVGSHKDIIILGNGGSNSIAAHLAEDYTKCLNKKALSFSDGARLTCYINDYGFENSYKEFIQHFYTKNTLVILISSSGESPNITTAGEFCAAKNIPFIVLSGFKESNALNRLPAVLKYHVASMDYGVIENSHQVFLHSIL